LEETAPYEYSNDGGTTWQGSNVFPNLSPGNLDVQIRDLDNPSCFSEVYSRTLSDPIQLDAGAHNTTPLIVCQNFNPDPLTLLHQYPVALPHFLINGTRIVFLLVPGVAMIHQILRFQIPTYIIVRLQIIVANGRIPRLRLLLW